MASTDGALLGTFQRHIEDMRALIHCKICLKPCYEPYTLSCGHTYCYSCLSGWVNGPHNRGEDKNCPDCRQRITSEPSPNFILRDLVHMFCNRVELLPEDETVREHEDGKAAEAKVIADDKKGPGLFKGRFVRRRFVPPGLPRVLRDVADGVDRCPACMWELEDGRCNSCGYVEDSDMTDSDSDDSDEHMDRLVDLVDDYDSDEDDRDVSPVDEFNGPVDIPVLPPGYHPGAFSDAGDDYSVDGARSPRYYSLDEDEQDSEMDDFIEDDLPNEVDRDDESVQTVDTYGANSPARQYGTDNGGVTEDDGESDDEVIQRYRPLVSNRRPTPIEIDQDSDSESETTTQATNYDNDTASETQTVDTDVQTVDDSSDESDDSSVRVISPPPAVARARKRRVVESEDDDSSGNESAESDDTAIRAPQPAPARRQRLAARREGSQRSSRTPSPQQRSNSAGSFARRGIRIRGRGGVAVPRRSAPYSTRVH